ncbi:MAG: TIGR02391 family protein [Chloroflexota bacterium]
MKKSAQFKLFAGIQYVGELGITSLCLDAIAKILHFGDTINAAKLLTCSQAHCFLLTVDSDFYVAVKSGFSSGYSGEGPRGLATALLLLERHGAQIQEYSVSKEIINKIDQSCLTIEDIELLENSSPVRPNRLYDYKFALSYEYRNDTDWLNELFPPTVPLGIIDRRLTDLALKFQENPDMVLISGYRRLEDIVRNRTGLSQESSSRLFSKAFHANQNKSLLTWENVDAGEHSGRSQLFTGSYLAFRNRRAHQEFNHFTRNSKIDALQEFLLLNQLYVLEKHSIEQVGE